MATIAIAELSSALEQLQCFKETDLAIKSVDSSDDILRSGFKRNDSGMMSFDIARRFKDISYVDSEVPTPTTGSCSPALSASGSELADVDIVAEDLSSAVKPRLGRKVAILGVGYVGLHLTEEFGKRHNVCAFDVSEARIKAITPSLAELPLVKPTFNEADLAGNEFYLISVPTLVRPDETVDCSYIESALRLVSKYATAGSTVVIESSVAVGMTRSLLAPLAARGIKGGMSPERVDPGRVRPFAFEIPKIISGLDDIAPGSLDSIYSLYSTSFDTVVPVSKPEVAEMTKLYENCQRMINIAYVNEMADACIGFGIDPFEVCKAAETKPFGYAAYRPSAGVGGHCIPVNPFYLFSNSDSWSLLHHATQTMNFRPAAIADRVMRDLYRKRRVSVTQRHTQLNPRVLVVGMGFKPGQSVLSNSPGLAVVKALSENWEAEVQFADPLVSQAAIKDFVKMDDSEWNAEKLAAYDAVVVVMQQHGLDFDVVDAIKAEGSLVHYCCK